MTEKSRSRVRAVSAFVAIVVSIGASFIACDTVRRANGEECLQNDDCLSIVCSSRVCIAAPPLLTGTPDPGSVDSATESGGGGDSSDSALPAQDASDSGPPADSAGGGDAFLDDATFDGALVDADATSTEDARDGASLDAGDATSGPDAAFRATLLSRLTAPDVRVA